jgi:hypothetical protein
MTAAAPALYNEAPARAALIGLYSACSSPNDAAPAIPDSVDMAANSGHAKVRGFYERKSAK